MVDATDALEAFREGRLHENPSGLGHPEHHLDGRTSFQKDRDRLLYSTALRRLAGITQVASADEGHVFHNRLTHTLKVAQIARRTAQAINRDHPKEAPEDQSARKGCISVLGGLDPCVAEAAALAHDIGHPPFGHIAEHAIQEVAKSRFGKAWIDTFEGNAQSFRIVTRVAVKAGQYPGLNLTRATRNGLLKYPWRRADAPEGYEDKWGYYGSEIPDFDDARNPEYGAPKGVRTLEAEIMDWADDVAYAVHDVEDFYRAGLLPLDELIRKGPTFDDFLDHPDVREETKCHERESKGFGVDPLAPNELFTGRDAKIRGAEGLQEHFRGTDDQVRSLHRFSSNLITSFLQTPSPQVRAPSACAISLGTPEKPGFHVHPHARFRVNLMKLLSQVYVFQAQPLMTKQDGQVKAIKHLMGNLYDAATGEKSAGLGRFPEPFKERIKKVRSNEDLTDEQKECECFRLVADLICSLNEMQTMDLYQSMIGAGRASLLRPLLV